MLTEQFMSGAKKMNFCPFFLNMGRCKLSKFSKGQLQPNLISWGVTCTIVKLARLHQSRCWFILVKSKNKFLFNQATHLTALIQPFLDNSSTRNCEV